MAKELIGYVNNRPVHLIDDKVITVEGTDVMICNVTWTTAYEVAKRNLKGFKPTEHFEAMGLLLGGDSAEQAQKAYEKLVHKEG